MGGAVSKSECSCWALVGSTELCSTCEENTITLNRTGYQGPYLNRPEPTDKELEAHQWEAWREHIVAHPELEDQESCDYFCRRSVFELGKRWEREGAAALKTRMGK